MPRPTTRPMGRGDALRFDSVQADAHFFDLTDVRCGAEGFIRQLTTATSCGTGSLKY